MTREERNIKLKHLITCMKCEVSGKVCDENCPTQYAAGNTREIIENLEAISEIMEQTPCEDAISRQYLLANCVVDAVTMPYVPVNKIKNAPPVTPQELSGDCHNKDRLVCVLDKIEKEINSPNRGTCDYFIVDRIKEIIDKYKTESEE